MSELRVRGQRTHEFPKDDRSRPVAGLQELGWVVAEPEEECPLCKADKCIQFLAKMDPMKVFHVRK